MPAMQGMEANFVEVWAVPGAHNVIDVIHPGTGLTSAFGQNADQVRARYPNAVRMSWEAWQVEAAARQHTLIEWDPTTQAIYHQMLECLPPAKWIGGAFLVGEPEDHDYSNGQPRFRAYWAKRDGSYIVANRPMTIAEFVELRTGA